jgi:uncharacterized protein YneR
MSNLYVLTVATHNEGYYDALKISAQRNNLNLITLGFGQKWRGFLMKYDLTKNYLNSLDDNDIVVFVDAYDVLILQNYNTIIEKFKSFNKPIVLSQDATPRSLFLKYFHTRIFGQCNNTHINSGLYIGYVWALKILFNQMCKYNDCNNKQNDDQIMLTNTCNQHAFFKKYLTIDYDSILFYTTMGGYGILNYNFSPGIDSDIINNKLIVKKSNQEPCFIHGPANTNLDKVAKIYNLPQNKSIRDELYKATVYLKPLYIKYFINDLLLPILIIAIIISLYLKKN